MLKRITLALALLCPSVAWCADSTVAALTAASALSGPELFYCVQGGADRKCTATQLQTFTFSTNGTGVTTALGVNVGSAGAFVTFNGAGGTPSSMVGTNITGTAAGLTAGNVTTNANATGPITLTGNTTSITSQTGTGTKFVVDTSPTLVTPALGVATGTSLALGGATIGSNALAVTGTSQFSAALTITDGTHPVAINRNTVSSFAALTFTGDGSNLLQLENSDGGVIIAGGGYLAIGGSAGSFATPNLKISAPAAGAAQHGGSDASIAVAQTVRVQSVVAGTAAANGANWTFIGSLPTGTGTSGDIIFQTGVKTGSGTTQGTPTTALTIKGETQALVTSALDAAGSTGGALQVAGGASVAKRFWIPAISASAGLQTAVLCQSSGGEMIADSVACLASGAQFKDILGPMEDGALAKIAKLPLDRWRYKPEGNFKSDDWTRERIGPIAQDVARMDKRLVGYDKDGNVRTFSTEQLLAFTIKAVQELKAKVDELKRARQ